MTKPASYKIIFFGNGPLADAALETLQSYPHFEILFHARQKSDLDAVARLKSAHPDAFGILASFGVILKPDFLALFEPTGIINLHPSLLPQYRGPSPIETAILAGDTSFSYSLMKLVPKMDAGPIYHQATFSDLPLDKFAIYQALASRAMHWLVDTLPHLPNPTPQDEHAVTYTKKLDKSLSELHPDRDPADQVLRQIIAYQGYPKPKYNFFGHECIILAAHLLPSSTHPANLFSQSYPKSTPIQFSYADHLIGQPLVLKIPHPELVLPCQNQTALIIDQLQPAGKSPMPARAFINGYYKS